MRVDHDHSVGLYGLTCATCGAPLATWEATAHERACVRIQRDWPGAVLEADSSKVLAYLVHREKVMAARARLAAATGTDEDALTPVSPADAALDREPLPPMSPHADSPPAAPDRSKGFWPFGQGGA